MKRTIVISNEEMFSEVTRMLSDGHRVIIPVKGYSMLPFIVGERDLVELGTSDVFKKDDIVLFQINGRWILHRIRKIDGNKAIIRGDGVYKNKEICPIKNIRSKAVCILHKGVKPVNPYSGWAITQLRVWNFLHPLRRYLLFAWRHLPWMRKYFKKTQ